MYERAIAADPDHANNLSNYAQFLFAHRRDSDGGELMASRALAVSGTQRMLPLRAECWFYLFAHTSSRRREAQRELNQLISDGASTGDWSFEPNLRRVREDDDPRLPLLELLAAVLANKEAPSKLFESPDW
jgi:hypothetical protein